MLVAMVHAYNGVGMHTGKAMIHPITIEDGTWYLTKTLDSKILQSMSTRFSFRYKRVISIVLGVTVHRVACDHI